MNVSIFTPTNDSSFLPTTWESIKDQSFSEWVIVHNNGSKEIGFKDKRVKEITLPVASEWVGPLKSYACSQCTGDILLELDHDDCLFPSAITEVAHAFRDSRVGFVYSNTVHCDKNWNNVPRFDEKYGWKYRLTQFNGHTLDEHISFEPDPNSISRIWFAPNHVRAFRRSEYEKVGGHSQKMRILDDLDLMCRMYLTTEFKHINYGLYLYRIHGKNSWLRYNREIQDNVFRIHDQYILDLASRWSDLNGLRKIELGGQYPATNFETVDLVNADIITDLNNPWPFEDNSVGAVHAYDVFEHLRDPLFTMKELYRILAPGGYAIIRVPSTDGRGAFADPTHLSFWNEASFHYYTRSLKASYIGTPVRFQAMRLHTTNKDDDGVCWTNAHLVKLNGKERVPGEVLI